MQEEWRPSRYGYEVSSLGRYRNRKGQIMKPHEIPDGRLKAAIRNADGNAEFPYLHLLVCEAFYGPRPDGLQVAHYDCNVRNNRSDNLRWATGIENMSDCKRNGCLTK